MVKQLVTGESGSAAATSSYHFQVSPDKFPFFVGIWSTGIQYVGMQVIYTDTNQKLTAAQPVRIYNYMQSRGDINKQQQGEGVGAKQKTPRTALYAILTTKAKVPSTTNTHVKACGRTPPSSSPPPLPEPPPVLVALGSAVASACPMVWVVTTPVLHPMSNTGHEVTVNTVVIVPVGLLWVVAIVAWNNKKM